MTTDPIPLEEVASFEALRDPAARARPAVVRGGAAAWPAFARWTFGSLAERLAGCEVPVATLRDHALRVTGRDGIVLDARPAADVLRAIERGDDGAYVMAPLDRLPPDLRRDAPPPAPCEGAPWRSSKLWVSPAGATSPLHFDLAHNLHAQVVGRKRFLLYERGHPGRMYPAWPWSSLPNASRVDPVAPDLARFPRFRFAAPRVCELAPGDVVFMPGGTWHHVTTRETSISVNHWWAAGAGAWLAHAADRWKRWRRFSR